MNLLALFFVKMRECGSILFLETPFFFHNPFFILRREGRGGGQVMNIWSWAQKTENNRKSVFSIFVAEGPENDGACYFAGRY